MGAPSPMLAIKEAFFGTGTMDIIQPNSSVSSSKVSSVFHFTVRIAQHPTDDISCVVVSMTFISMYWMIITNCTPFSAIIDFNSSGGVAIADIVDETNSISSQINHPLTRKKSMRC